MYKEIHKMLWSHSPHEQIFLGGSQWYCQRGDVCVERWNSSSKWSHKVRKLRVMNNILTVIIVFHVKRLRSFVCSLWPLQDFLTWETNQPDNWQNNEDCVHIRGTEHQDTGKLNDLPCTSTYPFICQKGANNLRFWSGFYLFYCSSTMGLIHGTRAEPIIV